MERLVEWTWRLRWLSWLMVGVATLIAWWLVPPVQFDQSIEGFFPTGHPGLGNYQHSRSLFGSDDLVFMAYVDPHLWTVDGMDRLEELADELTREVPGVVRVESLDAMPIPWRTDQAIATIASGEYSLTRLIGARATVGDIVRSLDGDEARMRRFRQRTCAHPLFRGVLIDADGGMTSLVVSVEEARQIDHKELMRELRRRGDAFARRHGFEFMAVAGAPVLVSDGFDSLDRDNRSLGFIAMGLMALTMFFAVRNPGWALLPLIAGWATWQIVRTLLWAYDLKLTLSSGPIVAQTVVLCMPAAAHLAMRYREQRHLATDIERAAKQTLSNVAIPIGWCALTAAVGYFATWFTSDVQPVKQFGLTMTASNLAAGCLSFLLAAGAMSLAFRGFRAPVAERLENRTAGLTVWVTAHPWIVVSMFVIPSALAALGTARLELESNPINIFRARSRVSVDYRRIEEHLGGIGIVELVLPAPEDLSVSWLQELQTLREEVRATDPQVVSEVHSAADLLLPESIGDLKPDLLERVVALKRTVLSIPRYRFVLDRLWNPEQRAARIMIRIRDSAPAHRKKAFLERLETWAAARSEQPTIVTGLSHLLTEVTHSMIATSYQSAQWSAGLVFLMLIMALRSLWLAVLALFPTALAVGLTLGVMGWCGFKIDTTTALVSSVAIGLSVDDTFHCLLHWKQELRAGRPPREALLASYASSGPGVILSSSAVTLGFLSTMFSEFVPTANFGWLVAVATLGGSAGNLLVLPAILSLSPMTTVRDGKSTAFVMSPGR